MKKAGKLLSVILVLTLCLGLLPTAFAAEEDKVSTVKVETLVEPIYDEAGSFGSINDDEDSEEAYAAVKVGSKWGYIDQTGKMVIQPQYDYAGTFQEGAALVVKKETVTYGEGEYANEGTVNRLYLLKADGKETPLQAYYYESYTDTYEYYDYVVYDTNEITGESIDVINSRWGCYDGVVFAGFPYLPNGTPITPKNITSLLPAGHNNVGIEGISMWGPCVNGVIPMRLEYYWSDHSDDGSYDYDEGAIAFYMDVNGNITRTFPKSSFYVKGYDGAYGAYAPDESGLSVVNYGRWLSEGHWDEENEVYVEGEFGGRIGAMRANGTWAVSPVYYNYYYFLNGLFFSQGLMTVTRDGEKWGAVNTSGKEVVPLQYDAMTSFNNDLAAVEKDGHWYYIDMYNNAYQIGTPEGGVASNIRIATSFDNNIAAVYDGKRAYCIVNTPVDGVLPAVKGTEDLAVSVYFPDYDEYLETGLPGLMRSVDQYAAIERDGKWGFLKLTFELEGLNPFEDVHIGDYYYDPVQWAVEQGITKGTNDAGTVFSPGKTCNRAEIVTFLWRAYNEPEPDSDENPFTDVSESDWYYKPVLWAVEQGITSGTGDGSTFNPGGTCSRKEAVTFQYRAAGKPTVTGGNSFTDVSADAFYADAVSWAVANGVTSGTGNGSTFSPDDTCVRGQIVTFLYRELAED